MSPRSLRVGLLLAGALATAGAAGPAGADWRASGRFFYRDREENLAGFTGVQVDRPARRVDVQVLDARTLVVLATGPAGLDGSYDLLVPDAQTRTVRVRALTSSAQSPGLHASVRVSSGSPSLYSATSDSVTGHSPGSNLNFGDLTALPEAGGEAFNVFDVVLNGLDFLKVLNGSWPAAAIVAYWSASSGDGTYFQPADNSIHLLGTDGYDDAVIGHEQGHFAAANFSNDDSPGGTHYLGDNYQDIRLSWSEGYATYFACSVRRRLGVANPGMTYYITTTGAPGTGNLDFSYELEGPSRGAVGAASELAVQALLWDIVDNSATADDSPGVDDDPLADRADEDVWEVMRNYLTQPSVANVALEDFWDGWFRPGNDHGRQAEMVAAFDALRVQFHADAFESDGTPAQAAYLPTDGSPQARTFYAAGDLDYAWFPAAAGETFLLETTELYSDANTYLEVRDSTGALLLANDNRSGGDASSRIDFTAPAAGRYFVRANHAADLGVYGSYSLRGFRGSASTVPFTDVGAASGTANTGTGRGVAWSDYDGDGWPDLYVCNLNTANALYQNQHNSTFLNRAVTAGVALNASSEGACFGDYDNDGDEDLFVATVGTSDALFQNRLAETGSAVFLNVTAAAGITDSGSGRTVNWVDVNRDGSLDLFVANVATGTCKLWLNNRNGTFTDATAGSGLAVGGVISSTWADYDRDGDEDVFLGCDGAPSHLMRNDGGAFADVTAGAGLTHGFRIFGADWGDFDGDGWLDLTAADAEGPNLLYRNRGDGTFEEVGGPRGAASGFSSVSSIFADHDLDGDLDLYVANYNFPNQLFDNVTGSAFSASGAGALSTTSRAAARADFDRDGDPDFFVTTEGADALLRNDGPSRPWLEVDLLGRTSNRDGIGSVITVSAGGRRQVRQVYAGQGFGSQNSRRAAFGLGLGVAAADTVMVDWPSRKRSLVTAVSANQILLVDEAGAVGVPDAPVAVLALALAAPWPNPAAGQVTFDLAIPQPLAGSRATLVVLSPAGRRVAQILDSPLPAGPHRSVWRLRDAAGARVAPGIYFALLRAGSETLTRKIVVLSP